MLLLYPIWTTWEGKSPQARSAQQEELQAPPGHASYQDKLLTFIWQPACLWDHPWFGGYGNKGFSCILSDPNQKCTKVNNLLTAIPLPSEVSAIKIEAHTKKTTWASGNHPSWPSRKGSSDRIYKVMADVDEVHSLLAPHGQTFAILMSLQYGNSLLPNQRN